MGDRVPIEILTDHILLGLSTKCLLRCRCVCKRWLELISGPEFTKMHIQHQQKHYKILCGPPWPRIDMYARKRMYTTQQNPTDEECRGAFYSLDLGSTAPPTLNRLPGFPVHCIKDYTLVRTLGYSNGMLCMEAQSNALKDRHLFFGNPSTGSYKILPHPIDNGPLIAGFGYDSNVDDYKFVRVDNYTRNPRIFSLKSNSWRINLQSSDKQNIIHSGYVVLLEGCFFGGSIYWIVENDKIIVFNLGDEEFRELPMPCDYKYGQRCSLKVVQGSLCIVKRVGRDSFLVNTFRTEMWMLKEDNNWMQLMKQVELIGAMEFHPLFFSSDGRILCCVEHGNITSSWTRKLIYVLIDPQTGRSENITISAMENNNFLDNFYFPSQYSGHIDSLVSPN